MVSVFLREQKRYSQEELVDIFQCSEEKTVHILKRLKEYGVLKAVKATEVQKDLSDLLEQDIEIADVEVGENEYLYVFTFVGVITIEGRVLKCYPKYLLNATAPKDELKQILKVLEKYNSCLLSKLKTLDFTDFCPIFWYNDCKDFDKNKSFFLQFSYRF